MEMTTREMLNAVIERNVTDAVVEKAQKCLEALDKRNEKRKSTPSKTTEANKVVREQIISYLADKDFVLGTEISTALGFEKPNKVSSLCVRMVNEGLLTSTEIKVKGGKRKGYKLA